MAIAGGLMSDAFAYLSVLLSIVLGLGMAEILQGYGLLLRSRSSVKLYAPALIWSVMVLILATHFWWASFGLAKRQNWSFAAFCAVLLQTIMLFMGAALVLPHGGPSPIDLRAHYYKERAPFFAFGLLFLLVGFLKLWLLSDPFRGITLGFFAFFTVMALLGLIFKRPKVHEILAPVMAAGIVIFITILFARLKSAQ
jgi:hypothetical protein